MSRGLCADQSLLELTLSLGLSQLSVWVGWLSRMRAFDRVDLGP